MFQSKCVAEKNEKKSLPSSQCHPKQSMQNKGQKNRDIGMAGVIDIARTSQ